jgi:hypothetical protein
MPTRIRRRETYWLRRWASGGRGGGEAAEAAEAAGKAPRSCHRRGRLADAVSPTSGSSARGVARVSNFVLVYGLKRSLFEARVIMSSNESSSGAIVRSSRWLREGLRARAGAWRGWFPGSNAKTALLNARRGAGSFATGARGSPSGALERENVPRRGSQIQADTSTRSLRRWGPATATRERVDRTEASDSPGPQAWGGEMSPAGRGGSMIRSRASRRATTPL